MGVICSFCCCPKNLRKVPTNYILLFVFTISESLMVAYVCILSNPEVVLMAAVFTLGITVALTVYAWTTDSDFTSFGGFLYAAMLTLFIFSFFALFTDNKFIHIFICSIGVLIFSIYIIYDTQLIMGGKSFELQEDDYIMGALALYIDVITLFLYILDLLSRFK